MTASTTKNKFQLCLRILLPLIFWLSVYEALATIIQNEYFFPHLHSVFSALFGMLGDAKFYTACLMTLLRVLTALLLGTLLGVLLGILSVRSEVAYSILNPFMSIVKATPVASLIIVLWIMMSGDSLAIVIALSMVTPMIWQSTYNSFSYVDRGLLEVSELFMLDRKYRFYVLYFPNLKKYLIPSVITSVGLAWKSEIATEIIAYTRSSIGQLINDGKYNLDTPVVFAWTFIVIFFSILFEALIKALLRRLEQ